MQAVAQNNQYTPRCVYPSLQALQTERAVLRLQVWNSDTSEDVRKQILSELVSDEPELRLLYTTPESLRNPSLRDYLKVGAMQQVPLLVMGIFGTSPAGQEACLQDNTVTPCLRLQLLSYHCLRRLLFCCLQEAYETGTLLSFAIDEVSRSIHALCRSPTAEQDLTKQLQISLQAALFEHHQGRCRACVTCSLDVWLIM
jgi:hypothetical protein